MENRTTPYGALLLRVALGAVLISHALLKLLVFTLPAAAAFLAVVAALVALLGAGAHSVDARRAPV